DLAVFLREPHAAERGFPEAVEAVELHGRGPAADPGLPVRRAVLAPLPLERLAVGRELEPPLAAYVRLLVGEGELVLLHRPLEGAAHALHHVEALDLLAVLLERHRAEGGFPVAGVALARVPWPGRGVRGDGAAEGVRGRCQERTGEENEDECAHERAPLSG